MNPKIWGPSAWIFLHSITFNYPDQPTEEIKNQYKTFFESLQFVLPCDKCKNNYKNKLLKFKLSDDVLKNKQSLIEWLIDIHNEVNKSNNKKILTYKEVIQKYIDLYDPKEKRKENINYNIIDQKYQSILPNLFNILLIIIFTLYCLKKKYLN